MAGWLLLSVAGCAGNDVETSYSLAASKLLEHDYREAAIHARNVLQADEAHWPARMVLGRTSLALAEIDDAVFHLSRAAADGAPHQEYAAPLARAHSRAGDFRAALEVLDAVPEDVRGTDYWIARSDALLGVRDLDGADAALDRAASDDAGVLAARARVAIARDDLRGAEALLRQAVARDANDSDAWSLLASTALGLNELARAEEAIGRAAEIYVRRGQYAYGAPALLQLVRIQIAQGKVDAAAATVDRMTTRFPRSLQAHLAMGMLAMRQGDMERAIDAFWEAARMAPDQPDISVLLGAAHLADGNLGQAEQHLSAALLSGPPTPQVIRLLAETRLRLGLPRAALEALERLGADALAQDPMLAFLAGVAYLGSGDIDTAIRLLEGAVERSPLHQGATLQLARAYSAAGRAEDAQRLLESSAFGADAFMSNVMLLMQTLRTEGPTAARDLVGSLLADDSTSAGNRTIAGILAYMINERAEAREHLKRALDANADFVPALLLSVAFDAEEGRMAEAEGTLRRVLELEPGNRAASLGLARLYVEAKRFPEAARLYRTAYELEPTWEALSGAVAAYRAAGSADWEPLLNAHLAKEPNDVAARLLLAETLQASERVEEALAAYDDVLSRDPSNLISLNNAAWLSVGQDPAKALRYGQRAVALAPENPAVLDTFGWALVHAERPLEALSYLEKASQLSSGSPEIGYHLAVAQARAGRREAARQTIEGLLSTTEPFPSRNEAQTLLDSL